MNKKRFIVLSICLLTIVGIGGIYLKSKSNDKIKNFEQVYFEMMENDIAGDKITSDEVVKNLKNISKKDDSFNYEKTEQKGNLFINDMNIYRFENNTEILGVSYSKDDNKEKYIEYISYELKKSDNEPNIGISYFKQKEGDYLLGTILYPENLSEQKQYFDIIQNRKEVNEIYNMYYELGPYIEGRKSISVEEIGNILGQKPENIERDTNDGITTRYVLEKDNHRFTILYNKEENKIFFTSIENDDNNINKVNLYCNEDNTEKESKMITMYSNDLNEQKTIFKEIAQSKK